MNIEHVPTIQLTEAAAGDDTSKCPPRGSPPPESCSSGHSSPHMGATSPSPKGNPGSPMTLGRTRRTAIRYTSFTDATSSPILPRAEKSVETYAASRDRHKEKEGSLADAAIPAGACTCAVVSGMQGWRRTMEDKHLVFLRNATSAAATTTSTAGAAESVAHTSAAAEISSTTTRVDVIVGVFDGHNGRDVSSYCAVHLCPLLAQAIESWDGNLIADLEHRLREAFLLVDTSLREQSGIAADHSGSTAVVFIATDMHFIWCNLGDSRAYHARCSFNSKRSGAPHHDANDDRASSTTMPAGGTLMVNVLSVAAMTTDHRPADATEEARIVSCGGEIVRGRVNGALSVTRGFGDFHLKDPNAHPDKFIISCFPDIKILPRHCESIPPTKKDDGDDGKEKDDKATFDVAILGCDGVWEVLTAEKIADSVVESLGDGLTTTKNASSEDQHNKDDGQCTSSSVSGCWGDRVRGVIEELLQSSCPGSVAQNGTTPGSDNMTMGVAIIL